MLNFIKNLFGGSLRSKVMKAISAKIKSAQKALDTEVDALKSEITSREYTLMDDFDEALKDLRFERHNRCNEITEKHVNGILSKIL